MSHEKDDCLECRVRDVRISRLERCLEKRDRRRKVEKWVNFVALALTLGFLAFFVARVTPVQVDGGNSVDPTSISFAEGHAEWLDEKYNGSVENGFCLFGHIEKEEVVVEDVEFVDNPFSQSQGSIRFTCMPQIMARSGELLSDSDYKLVGAIHTHPESPEISGGDKEVFELVDVVLPTYGVYNGERITMYSDPDVPVPSVLRFN